MMETFPLNPKFIPPLSDFGFKNLTGDELHAYHQWLKVKNDDLLRLKKAREEGEAKGRAEGEAKGEAKAKWEDAQNYYNLGVSIDIISKATGLSEHELKERLK